MRDLGLELEAFEGPFDLLLAIVLREELGLAEIEVAEIVVAFVERLAERSPVELEAAGEFLVLVSSLLELKARELFPEEEDALELLDSEQAAGELAERLAVYRRFRTAAQWLAERLESEGDRFFRLGPAPLAPRVKRQLVSQDPGGLAAAIRRLAAEPPSLSLAHLALTFPPVSLFLERFRALLRRRRRFLFDEQVSGLGRVEQAVAFLALLELRKTGDVLLGQSGPFEPITVWSARSA